MFSIIDILNFFLNKVVNSILIRYIVNYETITIIYSKIAILSRNNYLKFLWNIIFLKKNILSNIYYREKYNHNYQMFMKIIKYSDIFLLI